VSSSVRLPILVYHSIDDHGTSISTRPGTFEAQIRALAEGGWRTITLSEAARRILAGEDLPRRSVVLTFDDGMPSIRDVADPILREHGFTATTFVVTGQVGRCPEWYRLPDPYRSTPLLDIDELGRLRDAGWELQPHTHDHPVLPHLPESRQVDQIARSRELLRRWFDVPADVLAYPFGQYDETTEAASAAAGLAAAVTLDFGIRVPRDRPHAWPRIGTAWFKQSRLRQDLAVRGWLEWYVRARRLVKGDRARHFRTATAETTRGLDGATADPVPAAPEAATRE